MLLGGGGGEDSGVRDQRWSWEGDKAGKGVALMFAFVSHYPDLL